MLHTLTIYLRLLSVQIRSQMQYRISFLLDLMSTLLDTFFDFAAIALVLQQFSHIQGWTLPQIALLYGLVQTSFGLMDLIFAGFDPPYFARKIRTGSFDQLLLRPIPITLQVMGSEISLRRLGKVSVAATILVYALTTNDIAWTAVKLAHFPLIILSLILFYGGLFIVGATIIFWTIDSVEAMNILTYGSNFAISYPMSIYPDWLRRFFTYVLPAIFLVYYPALYLLDRPELGQTAVFAPFLSPIIGGGVFLLALRFWRFGIAHYQSSGS